MKVAIIGYGKMGRAIEIILSQRGHNIVGIANNESSISLEATIASADVAIEFSTPESAYSNIRTCIKNGVPVVSGTTGWLDKYQGIKKMVNENGGSFFYASNFSIGVNIFFELNNYLAAMMNRFPQYDVMLEETHHTEKKDSPSGTAITLAEGILSELEQKKVWKENEIQQKGILPIYTKRIGKVFGDHSIQYHNEIDTLKISHQAYSREGFAQGAVSAAEWLIGKKGVFGMNDMLGLTSKE